MAAQDTPDGNYQVHSAPSVASGDPPQIEPDVRGWLEARLAGAGRDVTVAVSALPGRWLFRVENGATASTIEHQTRRDDCTSADLATAVRRVAVRAGYAARIEASHGVEARIAVAPAVPAHS